MRAQKNLTKFDVEKMKKLRIAGYTNADIGKKFNVSEFTVRYHLNPHLKEILKKHNRMARENPDYRKKMSKNYMKRYRSDPEFKKKHIERKNQYQKNNPEKRKQYNENYAMKKEKEDEFEWSTEFASKKEIILVGIGVTITLILVFFCNAMGL